MHLSIILLMVSSIPGNHIFSRGSCFVFTRPWWPSCAMEMALSRRAAGTTMRLSRRMMLVWALTVSSCRTCLKRFNSVQSASWNFWGSILMFLHDCVCMRLAKHCMVISCVVASWISARVIAFGITADARKLTYSSARVPCLSSSLRLECLDKKSNGFWLPSVCTISKS